MKEGAQNLKQGREERSPTGEALMRVGGSVGKCSVRVFPLGTLSGRGVAVRRLSSPASSGGPLGEKPSRMLPCCVSLGGGELQAARFPGKMFALYPLSLTLSKYQLSNPYIKYHWGFC